MVEQVCCQCERRGPVKNFYGYNFCVRCEAKFGLHTDKTIRKNAESYARSESIAYEDEVVQRLQAMEKNFVQTKVKLLHILERLGEMT